MTPVDPMVVRKKLAVIVGNLQALEPVARLSEEHYRQDLFKRKGTERLLQELVEAAIDVNAHLLVQQGSPPPDDYHHGFLMLGERHILPSELASALAPSAGLRNRLVHEYDDILDTIVLDAVRTAQALFPKYVAAVEQHLSSKQDTRHD